jgi:hypothetical protein
MRQIGQTAGAVAFLMTSALAFFGCSAPPEKAAPPPPPVAAAPSPEPPKSVMFDSDPHGDWNIFPDPTSGDVNVYHKGAYVGSVDGHESDDPPEPHPDPNHRPDDTDDSATP